MPGLLVMVFHHSHRLCTFALASVLAVALAPASVAQKKPAPAASKTKPKSTEPPLPSGSGTPQAPETSKAQPLTVKKSEAMLKVITVREKSDKAGEVFKAFLEGKDGVDRSTLVVNPSANAAKCTTYFTTSPNKDFKVMAVQIQGTVNQPGTDRVIFPYFVATSQNRMGFLCAVKETEDGSFKVDFDSFATGHDLDLEKFLREKQPGPVRVLVGVARSHLFGSAPAGGEAKWGVYALEMPEPPIDFAEKPTFFADKASESGKLLNTKLGWSKGHLCYVTLTHQSAGAAAHMICTKYEPYAK